MSRDRYSRRTFLKTGVAATAAAMAGAGSRRGVWAAGGAPRNNPAAKYNLAWTNEIAWDRCVSIADFEGDSILERLAAAQAALVTKGGGVVFFPAGVYRLSESIAIEDGVVLRGAEPNGEKDARNEKYDPPAKFEFPKYEPKLEGEGMPIDSAFKGVYLADPAAASNCGIVNIAINRGHIDFKEAEGHKSGRNRIVLGCILKNAAVADRGVPDSGIGQHAWQRFTARHHAAVTVKSAENLLVANNRLPKSGEDNFTMNDYIMKGTKFDGVVFDYDNRPGLYINDYGLGGAGGSDPNGTPETYPWGFRKGIEIRDNYIYCTGRCAISFTGDGTICADNVIRFEDAVWRPTTTGKTKTSGSSTNDNRAVQMRGWRWTVEGNDYVVHRNWAADRSYRINDGEGLMHEDHVNSTVKNSRVIGNKGNSYISIYKTAGIDGLVVEGNDIRTQGGIAAIYVVASRNSGPYECRNVTISGNTTAGSGIRIEGEPAENNVVTRNRHIGDGGEIANLAHARVFDNKGYEVVTE